MTKSRRLQHAYGLVEMMVALAIGVLILAASVALMVNSKQAYTTQDSLARLQENGRFAMQFLTHDIRMAGYYGCANDITSVHSWLKGGSFQFNFNDRIEGSESGSAFYPSGTPLSTALAGSNSSNSKTIWPHTDAIALRMLDASNPVTLLSYMPQQSSDLKASPNSGLNAGDVVMLTDCSSSDMFQISSVNTSNSSFDNVVHNTGQTNFPGNDPAYNPLKLSKRYNVGAQFMKFQSVIYFISGSTSDPTRPALWRQSLVLDPTSGSSVPTNQELVEGIESLQITYGIDTDGDRVPDYYTTADAVPDWSKVVAVRVGILATTLTNDSTPGGTGKQSGTDVDTHTYKVNGYTWPGTGDRPAGDRRERRVFFSTIFPRNLQ